MSWGSAPAFGGLELVGHQCPACQVWSWLRWASVNPLGRTARSILLDVVRLQPDAGDVDRLAMRREAAVGVVDVVADLARAVDDVAAYSLASAR